jgi:DNA repair protein RadA/Sms
MYQFHFFRPYPNTSILAKAKIVFVCSNCGNQSPKWMGQCHSCESWNTYQEEVIEKVLPDRMTRGGNKEREKIRPQLIQEIATGGVIRYKLPDSEINRTLGGGLVPGSVILLGGNPGIGKSTLLLQIAGSMADPVLYVSGEESAEQVRMRADRLTFTNKACYILTETNTEAIIRHARELMPALMVIDSIQTLISPHIEAVAGTVSQIREATSDLMALAKQTGIPILLIGHITKDGQIAGPKLLEHMVDTVLQFEGDRQYTFRILRSLKNRFGSTDELGIYEMHSDGLHVVENPSSILLSQREEILSGSAVGATVDGQRAMLFESQALVSTAIYGTPQRSATGFDLRRLAMLLAVLEKRVGFHFGANDVFLNMAGGLRADDPAIDLAVLAALMSSLEDIPVSPTDCFAGEVGLSGEVRAVSRIDLRIQEAARLGFKRFFLSKYNMKGLPVNQYKITCVPIARVDELFQNLFR